MTVELFKYTNWHSIDIYGHYKNTLLLFSCVRICILFDNTAQMKAIESETRVYGRIPFTSFCDLCP